MEYFICIESGTSTCSVALAKGLELIDMMENHGSGNNHAQTLTVYVQSLLENHRLKASDLSAVVVSKGPGSYTGLRIGVSAAKGICYAASIPLIAIGSLESMAYGAVDWLNTNPEYLKPDYLCPMIDARRLEVYTQLFDLSPKSLSEIEAKILNQNSFTEILEHNTIAFFGNGSDKAKDLLKHKNALFIEGFYPSARFMIPIALEYFKKDQYENVAYFEPLYLKDFVAIKATNKVLGA